MAQIFIFSTFFQLFMIFNFCLFLSHMRSVGRARSNSGKIIPHSPITLPRKLYKLDDDDDGDDDDGCHSPRTPIKTTPRSFSNERPRTFSGEKQPRTFSGD